METDQTASPSTPSPSQPSPPQKDKTLGGIVLIVLGLLFLADNLWPELDCSEYWPVILIAIGGVLIWKSRRSG